MEEHTKLLKSVLNYDKYGFLYYRVNQAQCKNSIYCACLSRNQEWLALGCSRNTLLLYDLIQKKFIPMENGQIIFRKAQIISIAFSYYYEYIMAGNANGDVLIYSMKSFTLIKFTQNYLSQPIHSISAIQNFTIYISSNQIAVQAVNDQINGDYNQQVSVMPDVISTFLLTHNEHFYLYCGTRLGELLYCKQQTPMQRTPLRSLLKINQSITNIEVAHNNTLIAIAYQNQDEEAFINIYHRKQDKKLKPIYQSKVLAKQKMSCLKFFHDNTHLMMTAWDGSFKIIDIEKKKELDLYSHNHNSSGVIKFFPIQQQQSFPQLITVSQNGQITKVFFGQSYNLLFQYIPFVFWVELRIRQELQFHSDILDYLKLLYIQAVGVEINRQKEQNVCAIAFELFQPLLKYLIDIQDKQAILKEGNRQLIVDDIKNLFQPIEKLPSKTIVADNQDAIMMKILNSFDCNKIIIFNLQKCPFLFEQPFLDNLLASLAKMKQLRYLDLSFNNLEISNVMTILNTLKSVTNIEFLNLAHNKLNDLSESAYFQLLDDKISVSLRSNNLSDLDGEKILRQIKYLKKLKILDISGNLEFGDETLKALQRITILQDKIEFAEQRNDIPQFINLMKIFKEQEDQEQEDGSLKAASIELPEGQPLMVEDRNTVDRQSSTVSNQIITMSLQLLCIQFTPQRCEEAMKTATDFLVFRKITNLYIYVVDNKIDNVWESSISIFYTKPFTKIKDYVQNWIGDCCGAVAACFGSLYKLYRIDLRYCCARIFCSWLCLYKYFICGCCTFLVSPVGEPIVKIFGVVDSIFEYNEKVSILEENLEQNKTRNIILSSIYFIGYYFVVIFLPMIFVVCDTTRWEGHLLYLCFALYSFILEGYLGYEISQLKVTQNQYTSGPTINRILYVLKDVLLSQLNKFQLYCCICFIIVLEKCGTDTIIWSIGVALIGLNVIIDLYLGIRFVLFKQYMTYIGLTCQFSTLYQMHLVTNLLEKWSTQPQLFGLPQKIFISFIKTFLSDIPLLVLQILFKALNTKTNYPILDVSLAICIIHGLFSTIKLLTITKPSKINSNIMTVAMSTYLTGQTKATFKPLLKFIQKFKLNIQSLIQSSNQQHELAYQHLTQDLPPQQLSNEVIVPSRRVVPLRKGITMLGNKVQRIKVQNQTHSDCYQKLSIKQAMDLFGPKIQTWHISNVPYQIVEVLLVDVPRSMFYVYDLEWNYSTTINYNIHISSLAQEMPGIIQIYEFLRLATQPVRILEIGFGSGYITAIIAALVTRLNKQASITSIDHVPGSKQSLIDKLSKFPWINCEIEIYEQDCFEQLPVEGQFDFIYLGAAVTKYKFEKTFQPLCKGEAFGYEILTANESVPFIYRQCFIYLKEYPITEYQQLRPLQFQYSINQPNEQIQIKKYNEECSMCRQMIQDKYFLNFLCKESICFDCGNKNLEDECEQIDIGKMYIKFDVILCSDAQERTVKCPKQLFQPVTYKVGQKSINSRSHKPTCKICKKSKVFGFIYYCLICTPQYSICNGCGMNLFQISGEQKLTLPPKCSFKHVFLRCIFAE